LRAPAAYLFSPCATYDNIPAVSRISTPDVWAALREGNRGVAAAPSLLHLMVLIHSIIGTVLAFATSDRNLMPLFYAARTTAGDRRSGEHIARPPWTRC
jgi:uncharacterized membrane protein